MELRTVFVPVVEVRSVASSAATKALGTVNFFAFSPGKQLCLYHELTTCSRL